MSWRHDDEGEPKGCRRVLGKVLVAILGLVAIVVGAFAFLIYHWEHRVNANLSEAVLCTQAALELNVPSTQELPRGAMAILPGSIVKTTAGQVAAEYTAASQPAQPWDQEPPSTPVVRCHRGDGVTWFVDRQGHASILSAR
jgi:hypothetical protein